MPRVEALSAAQAEQFKQEELQRDRLLRDAILRRVDRARRDPKAFFQFVMREETTRRKIACLPHQRVLYDFVMRYPRSVVRMPVGFSKTYTMAGLTMWLLGRDPTSRGAVISATQEQATKPVGMVRDYIESSAELQLVWPNLRQSPREGDWWTQRKLVVDRPAGIRDPSLTAVGVEGALPGARLNWMLIDDILDRENTRTDASRKKVHHWFNTTVLSRRDVADAKIVVTNTPWHPEDLTFRLEEAGWPTLIMDCEGGIFFHNADDFDTPDVRPSMLEDEATTPPEQQEHRLTGNDAPEFIDRHYPEIPKSKRPAFDTEDRIPLWPAKFTRSIIQEIRTDYAAAIAEFNQLYMCVCRDDESARFKLEWAEKCKAKSMELGYTSLVHRWDEELPTFTGVDLAIGRKRKHDYTALFTFAILPNQYRLILDIDFGRWPGKTTVKKIKEKHEMYNSIVTVENNAAQDFLRQWVVEDDMSIPIRAHHTGQNKSDPSHGVESIFIEMENTVWLLPCPPGRKAPAGIEELIKNMHTYDPNAHTGDVLMAMWIAREAARNAGLLRKGAVDNRKGPQASIAATLMAR